MLIEKSLIPSLKTIYGIDNYMVKQDAPWDLKDDFKGPASIYFGLAWE